MLFFPNDIEILGSIGIHGNGIHLPAFTIQNQRINGKYTIHGWYGLERSQVVGFPPILPKALCQQSDSSSIAEADFRCIEVQHE